MLKNLKKRRAQHISEGELMKTDAYNFFPLNFEMPKVKDVLSPTTRTSANRKKVHLSSFMHLPIYSHGMHSRYLDITGLSPITEKK